MRPQDEILVTLPRQPAAGRRFLLRRLAHLPLMEDGPLLYDFLTGLAPHGDQGALLRAEEDVWERLELDRLRRSVGETSGMSGTWTTFLSAVSPSSMPEGVEDAHVQAGAELEALLDPLVLGLEANEASLRVGTRCLGRIHSERSLRLLLGIATERGAIAPAVSALTTLGTAKAAEIALDLVQAVEGTSIHPELIAHLGRTPTPSVMRYLGQVSSQPSSEILAGVASALEGFRDEEALPFLDRLLAVRDPWVLINTVETLGRMGSLECLKRLDRVFETQAHPLIRIGCLQAAAASQGPAVITIAEKGLATPDPNVQAAALEALVASGAPHQVYRDAVVRLLESPHPKLALNAALACVAVDPARAAQKVTDFLNSGDPVQLLRAIHCLAYIEAPNSIQALQHVLAQSPPGTLRIEATKAMGRLVGRVPGAAEPLLKLLPSLDLPTYRLALCFLTSAHPASRVKCAQTLTQMVRAEDDPKASVPLIEALGALGPAGQLSVPDLHHLLLSSPQQAVAAAKALAISFPRSKEAQDLSGHSSPLIQGFGGLAAWLDQGRGIQLLVQTLKDPDPSSFQSASEVVRLAAAAGAWTAKTRRLVGLAKSLGAAKHEVKEAVGLGLLDQSLTLPRKRIGLGISPKVGSGLHQIPRDSLRIQTEQRLSEPHSENHVDEAVLAQNYYESGVNDVSRPPDSPPRAEASPPASAAKAPPTAAPASARAPEDAPRAPAPGTPRKRPGSLLGTLIRGLGILVLCGLAVALGTYLRAWKDGHLG